MANINAPVERVTTSLVRRYSHRTLLESGIVLETPPRISASTDQNRLKFFMQALVYYNSSEIYL